MSLDFAFSNQVTSDRYSGHRRGKGAAIRNLHNERTVVMANRSEDLAAIRPEEQYPLELFESMVGLGRAALREARRKGLKVEYVHGRAFVRGSDWLSYCDSEGKGTKDE
jgi:hypothetical protein